MDLSEDFVRVLHLCVAEGFIESRAYQENELVAAHHAQGHEVLVIASTRIEGTDGKPAFASPGRYVAGDEVPLIRLPYHPWIPRFLARYVRMYRNLYQRIEAFRPDVILFHSISGWELLTVARYSKHHPDVAFYADNHADDLNSARSFLSRWVLHYLFYRPVLRRALPQIRKVLCISLSSRKFAHELYGVPESKLEFYPLGGRPIPDEEYERRRIERRTQLDLADDAILIVQSGKQSRSKMLPEALRAFSRVRDSRFRYLVAGLLMDDVRAEVQALMAQDDRVIFKDWVSPDELENYLCAADLYSQPGSQSSTMQTSMCCRCAVLVKDMPNHAVYVDRNGWLVANENDIQKALEDISANRIDLKELQAASYLRAQEMLDYAVLSQRVLK